MSDMSDTAMNHAVAGINLTAMLLKRVLEPGHCE